MKTSRCLRMMMGAALTLFLAGGASAMDPSGHAGMMEAPAGKPEHGVVIRTASVEGYKLSYVLLNWQERNVAMKGMEGMAMAGMDNSGNSDHHLMLYLTDADGKDVGGAKVGFQVNRPDGGEQKTLTMVMGGGYGADLNLKAKGVYTIKTKFVVGAKTSGDTFTHEVK